MATNVIGTLFGRTKPATRDLYDTNVSAMFGVAYDSVLSYVQDGWTIADACAKLRVKLQPAEIQRINDKLSAGQQYQYWQD